MSSTFQIYLSVPQNMVSRVKPKICFIHIPKCGGTSINEGIRKSLGLRKFSPGYFKIDSSRTRRQAEKKAIDFLEFREELLITKLESDRIRYVTGHSRCRDLTRARFEKDWYFLTLLRDPVKRWISEYFFNKYKKSNHFKSELPLVEYMKTDFAKYSGSVYVHYFANTNFASSQSIAQTKHNLDQFHLVGILEDLASFKDSFKIKFGITLEIKARNTNPISGEEIQKEISASQLEKIKKLCAPDIEIYNYFKSKN